MADRGGLAIKPEKVALTMLSCVARAKAGNHPAGFAVNAAPIKPGEDRARYGLIRLTKEA
jgi:hypothetical protein